MSTTYITGGATGIGAATVRKFASHGDDIAVFDINREAVERLANDVDSGSVSFFETDVRSRESVRSSIATASQDLGPPTTLFVNAGVQKLQGIFEMQDEDIDLIIDENPIDMSFWYVDADGDGFKNGEDNCPETENPFQFDLDEDGEGDLCDGDRDGDGLSNEREVEAGTSPKSSDSDGDGVDDGDEKDWDKDSDGDGRINALDPDSDNDGVDDVLVQDPYQPGEDFDVDLGPTPTPPTADEGSGSGEGSGCALGNPKPQAPLAVLITLLLWCALRVRRFQNSGENL